MNYEYLHYYYYYYYYDNNDNYDNNNAITVINSVIHFINDND